jgi:ElaB/YqjD/DUF883 family membrane-anchored ribosome-binding protein
MEVDQSNGPSGRATNLSRKAGKVVEDLKDLGTEALCSVEDAIQEIKARSGEAVESARQTGEQVVEKGRERVENARLTFEDFVASNPSKSVLIAAAIGALVGFSLRGRS